MPVRRIMKNIFLSSFLSLAAAAHPLIIFFVMRRMLTGRPKSAEVIFPYSATFLRVNV
jgi:hypothetical protein